MKNLSLARYSALCVSLGLSVICGCGSSDGGLSNATAGATAGGGAPGSAGSSSTAAQGGAGASAGAGPSAAGSLGASGATGAAGSSSSAGSTSAGGAGQAGSAPQAGAAGSVATAGSGAGGGASTTAHFSFFVTSLEAIRRESKNENGYGGNLGGLAGADAICTRIAEASMPGSGAKGWKAFLSTSKENAIERIGSGPWYDRNDKLVANDTAGLLQERPAGMTTVADLPNELGVPNRAGTGTGMDDNHDTVTASNTQGKWDGGSTCEDWTSTTGSGGPRVGHSWPANSGKSWIQAHNAPGCEPSVALVQMGGGSGSGIGNGGGYGGFYCFALKP